MLRNYLKIAWRNIWRQKLYGFINISGLAVGMAAAALIVLWIQDELTYDRIYTKTDRLYLVYNQDMIDGSPWVWGTSPPPLAAALKQDYPEVEDAARYVPVSYLVAAGDKRLTVNGAFADDSFLKLFDLPLAEGNRKAPLSSARSMVITRALAEKLFGSADAQGKMVQIDNNDYLTIAAVLENIPANSRFNEAEYLLPWSYLEALGGSSDSWNDNNYYTYVLLREGADVTLLSGDFIKLVITAMFIASPIAWYVMNKWLQNFAYHINIEWWIFALTGLLAAVIALLTVSFQSVKAALMNPVRSLRSE